MSITKRFVAAFLSSTFTVAVIAAANTGCNRLTFNFAAALAGRNAGEPSVPPPHPDHWQIFAGSSRRGQQA